MGSRARRETSSQPAENGPIKATSLLRQLNKEEAKIAQAGLAGKMTEEEKEQNECRVQVVSILCQTADPEGVVSPQTHLGGWTPAAAWRAVPAHPSSPLEADSGPVGPRRAPSKCHCPTSHFRLWQQLSAFGDAERGRGWHSPS